MANKTICEKRDTQKGAEELAVQLSAENKGVVLSIIKAKIYGDSTDEFVWTYYVDSNGFIRNNEELIAQYENGAKLKL